MKQMSIGLIAFRVAVLMATFVTPKAILMSLLVVGVFTLFMVAVSLVNKIGGPKTGLKDLGIGMIAASIGLATFGLALYIFKGLEFQDVMKGGLAMLFLAGGMVIVGMARKQVLLGSLAMIIASVAIGIFGYVIQEYFNDEKNHEL